MKISAILFFLYLINIYSQSPKPNNPVLYPNYSSENGYALKKIYTNPVIANPNIINQQCTNVPVPYNPDNNTVIRWQMTDEVSIVNQSMTSRNGQYQAVSWYLNNNRVSLFNNTNNTPLWEYFDEIAYTSISDTGQVIAASASFHIYLFNRNNNTPIFNFDITTLPDTGYGGPVALTKNGSFLVASVSRQDSGTIFGFNGSSNVPVWRYKFGESRPNGAWIQGLRISGNDSLIIVNSYYNFYVLNTYTGQLIFSSTLNPLHDYGAQTPQGISGNGNIIATVNNEGYVRVFQRSGNTYNLLWQHQEPPGTYYNWMTAVDVSYDGSMIASGTMNWITSSSWDGKIKLFKTTNGSSPEWTYPGLGDMVTSLSFSKDGKILAGVSWGSVNGGVDNLLIWKTTYTTSSPIYKLTTPGSFNSVTVSDNGSTVVAGGKKVHSRVFGNGGQLYNIFVDTSDVPVGIANNTNIPAQFRLEQNYPNPFNPSTKIKFDIGLPFNPLHQKEESERSAGVVLKIYDILGKEVATLFNQQLQPGTYEVVWNASDYPSGVYFYRLKSEDFSVTKKMVLIK